MRDQISDHCRVSVADGSHLPFRDDGRMIFIVIWIMPGLSRSDHKRALEAAPVSLTQIPIILPCLNKQTGQ
ncbi:MAG: hypothetical protein OEY09_06985 [Gammaproteobacteria bacterium]|nr:hypothetical protein [Gammaproteobacteria bacterium]